MSSKSWVFTYNNYDLVFLNALEEVANYYIYGVELGGETQTLHLQGYVEMDKKVRLAAMKKICSKIHWEMRMGTQDQAITYCMKDGNFVEWGKKKKAGARTDITTVRNWVNNGESMEYITQNASSYQAMKCGELIYKYKKDNSIREKKIIWIHGPSASGKTGKAVEYCEGKDFYIYGTTGEFWDGYDGEKFVILDELRPSKMPLEMLLRILDKYPFRCNIKGSSRMLQAHTIIVTSPLPPDAFIPGTEEKKQLLRRINTTIKTVHNKNYVPEVGGNTIPSHEQKLSSQITDNSWIKEMKEGISSLKRI